MNVLVDTSVWVSHFKQRNEHLVGLLESGRVVSHPYVVVELACGTPPNQRAVIDMLNELDHSPVASPPELLALIERRSIHARGCGLVDVSLLASALIDGRAQLWTEDKRLNSVAADLGLGYVPVAAC